MLAMMIFMTPQLILPMIITMNNDDFVVMLKMTLMVMKMSKHQHIISFGKLTTDLSQNINYQPQLVSAGEPRVNTVAMYENKILSDVSNRC